MPFIIVVLSVLIVIFAIFDFIKPKSVDENARRKLADYFITVETGNWHELYMAPARVLVGFMERLVGTRTFSLRRVFFVGLSSITLTAALYFSSIIWLYVVAILQPMPCPAPELIKLLQVPIYMAGFLVNIFAINFIFDFVAWGITIYALKVIGRGVFRSSASAAIFILMFGLLILWCMYAIYLPLTIKIQANNMGFPFGWREYEQIFYANLGSIGGFFTHWRPIYTITCGGENGSQFSISNISTMQILALEVALPFILFLIFTGMGLLAYSTRRVSQPIISRVIEKLQSHPKSVFGVLVLALVAIKELLEAIVEYG